MKRFATIALSFAVVLGLMATVTLAAETEMAPDVAAKIENLKNRLNLTPDQVEKLKPVIQEEGQRLKMIHQKYEGDTSPAAQKQFMNDAEPVRKDFNERIEKILTPDQMKEWGKVKEERKEELKHMMKSST